MAQSKKLNQLVALAVDTAAMKGKFKRRNVIDQLIADGSRHCASGGDNTAAHRLLLYQEVCWYMDIPLAEHEKEILRMALPSPYRAAIEGARKYIVTGNGQDSEHCLFWLAAPEQMRGEAHMRRQMAKGITRRLNLLLVTADFIESHGAKNLADLSLKFAKAST